MAARQPLALVGGAYEAYSTGDDARFNSLGVGGVATGTAGQVKLFGGATADILFDTAAGTRSAAISLVNSSGLLAFENALGYTFNNALRGPDGTLAAPTFAFTTETNTGLRLASAGSMRAVVAGVDVLTFASSGLLTVAGRVTGVSAPTAASDAVRADEAAFPIGAAPGTLTSAGGATKYSGPFTTQPNTTETAVSFLVPHAMVLRNLRVRAQAAPTGASVLFTAFVNEVANTALEVDYLTTSSGTVSDAVGSITLAAGDRLSIKIVMNTGYNDNSMTDVRWSLDATRL